MIKLVKTEIKKRKVVITLQERNDFFCLTIHARRFRKPILISTKVEYKKQPTIYDEHGNPIIPIRSGKTSKKIHPFQRPTIFTKKETKEILEKKS